MTFGDYDTAARMRDVITKIATDTINRLRPESMIGEVYSYVADGNTAQVRMPGHEANELLQVRFASDKVPTLSSELGSETPDVVRVTGRPGHYWISDFVRGEPRQLRYERGIAPVGSFMWYGGDTAPDGWIICTGQYASIASYPELFAVWGHKYNRVLDVPVDPGDGTFRFPDPRIRYIVGANMADVNGDFDLGSNDESGLTTRVERHSHSHSHSISGANGNGEANAANGTTQGNLTKYGDFNGHAHGGSTGIINGIGAGSYHAWLALNLIAKY